MEGLEAVDKNVREMREQISFMKEKIQGLGDLLQESSQKKESAERKLEALKQALQGAKFPPYLIQNCDDVIKTVEKLLLLTSQQFDNLCHVNEYNDRVFLHICFKVSDCIGKTPGLWKELAEKLLKDYPKDFINDFIDEVSRAHPTEERQAHECLARWKVYVGTYVDKVEPLKKVLQAMDNGKCEALCQDIDQIMAEYNLTSEEYPKGMS